MSLFNNMPETLNGTINPESIANTLKLLSDIPDQIARIGSALDDIEHEKSALQKRLNSAKKNLEVAEATALLFPDKELKNEGQRKAYILQKTLGEQDIIMSIINELIDQDSNKLELDREYKRLVDTFGAAKTRSLLMSHVFRFLVEMYDK